MGGDAPRPFHLALATCDVELAPLAPCSFLAPWVAALALPQSLADSGDDGEGAPINFLFL